MTNIITCIRTLYFGPLKKDTFIPAEEPDIEVENYITYIDPQEDSKKTDFSIIDGVKCVIHFFDQETCEWVFIPDNPKLRHKEFRFADISSLEVFTYH